MMSYQLKAIFKGFVQGVFFRAHIKKLADRFNVKGYVRNRNDSSVEMLAISNKETLEKLLDNIKSDPGSAKIDEIKTEFSKTDKKFISFEIRY